MPFNDLAMDELQLLAEIRDHGFVFSTTGSTAPSGWSKAKARLDGIATAQEPWRTHDLRRTLAIGLQRLGVRFEVTEAVLNHISDIDASFSAREARPTMERLARSCGDRQLQERLARGR